MGTDIYIDPKSIKHGIHRKPCLEEAQETTEPRLTLFERVRLKNSVRIHHTRGLTLKLPPGPGRKEMTWRELDGRRKQEALGFAFS